LNGPHKHRWDDVDQDNWAYVPDDIRTDVQPREKLLDFLAECNVRLEGTLAQQDFGFQVLI
jgi:hypothetical protein